MYTKPRIIATIGPASKDQKTLHTMALSGMEMARLNFSWGTHESHDEYIQNIRHNAPDVPIMQDLSGPRIPKGKEHTYDSYTNVFTNKDKDDLRFGLEKEVDWIALSFVRDSKDIDDVRAFIQKQTPAVLPRICAKIERPEAIDNLEDIARASDALMIARGDLSSFLPPEKIHQVVEDAVAITHDMGKSLYVATNLLKSMIDTDIANPEEIEYLKVLRALGATGVVFSNETATGSYPASVVRTAYQAFCV